MREHAPIALFTFARLSHTRRTVESLQRNHGARESDLVIYSDGPGTPEQLPTVTELRSYLKSIDGFRSVRIVERDQNLGLAQSIITGVNELTNEHGRVIVLEDDMVTSPWFLTYMNDGLEQFEADERVISLHGYSYPVDANLPEAFFLRGADCWGWATWQRAWQLFEPNGQRLLDELVSQQMVNEFDFDGEAGFSDMLRDQIAGRNDSWAVRWYATAFLANKLTLYPGRSLVHNIGLDASGTHSADTKNFDGQLAASRVDLSQVPVEPCDEARTAFVEFMRNTRESFRPGLIARARRRIAKLLSRQRRD